MKGLIIMKKLKKYYVYMDDGHDCFKVAVPALNEKDAREYVQGNGEVIAIKQVETPMISISCVEEALRLRGFGSDEMNFILRTLQRTGITDLD